MILMQPKKIFSIEEIKSWSLYEEQLKDYPTVAKYFENLFKIWVLRLDNPLAVLWVRLLLENKLEDFEKFVKNLSEKNPELLKKIIDELPPKKRNEKSQKIIQSAEVIKKLVSVNGELFALKYLSKKFTKITPYTGKYGDYLCDDIYLVSVKTKNDINFNRFVIENYVYGLLSIKDYLFLKKFRYDTEQIDGIDDSFRNVILEFIRSNMIDFIGSLPEPQDEDDDNALFEKDGLKVKGSSHIYMDKKKIDLEFLFNHKSFKLSLEEGYNQEIFEFDPVISYWVDNHNYELEKIEKSIDDWLNDFDDKSLMVKKYQFVGMINIPVTYINENGFLRDNEEVKNKLETKCQSKNYKIVFCFYPFNINFNFTNEMIFDPQRETLCQNKNKV